MPVDQLQQARAVEQAWSMAWFSLGAVSQEPRSIAEDTPRWVRVYTPGAQETLVNIVLRYRSPSVVTMQDLELAIAPYRRYRLPFQWWLTRGTEPEGLRDRLVELGMQSWGGATSMTLPLSGWQPSYREVNTSGCLLSHCRRPEDAESALQVICAVFFLSREPMARWTTRNPATQIYLATVGGRPAAALTTSRHNGVVGVYHVATLPFARRHGIAGNLLILALREAIEAGCTTAVLTATPEARHLYEQLGFVACGWLEQWSAGPVLLKSLIYGPTQTPSPRISWPAR